MDGPFATLADFCKTGVAREQCVATNAEEKPKLSCDWQHPAKKIEPAAPPFSAVRVFASECSQKDGDLVSAELYLAVQAANRWYVVGLGDTVNTERQTQQIDVQELAVRDVLPGGAPELLVRTSRSSMYRGLDASEIESLHLFGIGPSGKPSGTAAITVEESDDKDDLDRLSEPDYKPITSGGKLKATFFADGIELVPVKRVGDGLPADVLSVVTGRHRIVFP
jgi:hypothetical protein